MQAIQKGEAQDHEVLQKQEFRSRCLEKASSGERCYVRCTSAKCIDIFLELMMINYGCCFKVLYF